MQILNRKYELKKRALDSALFFVITRIVDCHAALVMTGFILLCCEEEFDEEDSRKDVCENRAEESILLVTGSFYLVSEVVAFIG